MMDYRVPVYHGLLSKKFLDEQRLSQTMDENSFARESLSIWTRQHWSLLLKNEMFNLLNCWKIISANIQQQNIFLI